MRARSRSVIKSSVRNNVGPITPRHKSQQHHHQACAPRKHARMATTYYLYYIRIQNPITEVCTDASCAEYRRELLRGRRPLRRRSKRWVATHFVFHFELSPTCSSVGACVNKHAMRQSRSHILWKNHRRYNKNGVDVAHNTRISITASCYQNARILFEEAKRRRRQGHAKRWTEIQGPLKLQKHAKRTFRAFFVHPIFQLNIDVLLCAFTKMPEKEGHVKYARAFIWSEILRANSTV